MKTLITIEMMRIHSLVGLLLAAFLLAGCGAGDRGMTATEKQRKSISTEAAEFLLNAEQAFKDGAFNASLVLLDSAGRHAPELADVHFLRGRVLTAINQWQAARTAYERVIELDPDYQGVWINMGNLASRWGRHRDALTMYRKERAETHRADVLLSIGRAYEALGRPDSARTAYEQAAAHAPASGQAFMRLANILRDQGRFSEARDYAEQGLALDPKNTDYQFMLASILSQSGEMEAALPYFERVLEAEPHHYWALYTYGQTLVRLGRREEGAATLERATQMQALLDEIEHWQQLAQTNPDQLMLWVRLGDALRRAGRAADAERADGVALALAPDYMIHEFANPTILSTHRAAVAALITGDPQDAMRRYEALLEAGARHPDIWLNLGVLRAATGNLGGAEGVWRDLLDQFPGHPLATAYLAQISIPFSREDRPVQDPALL